jgi:transcriptional regulator with PAS, ATPase and Fis domain
LTETLFESELFGHEKGAFTGATTRKPGLVETAQGGTLFLDEIGDVPLGMQVKLLRLIESGTYRRVGSIETQHANFRLVAATHKSLEKMMAEGTFRPDLYYRISAFPIHLPALRERSDDIALLVHSFLQRTIPGQRRLTIEPQALLQLQLRAWPGNIRELRNVLDRARLFADDGVIRCAHLPSALGQPAPAALSIDTNPSGASLPEAIATFAGTRSELATELGISERTLYRRLKKQGLA